MYTKSSFTYTYGSFFSLCLLVNWYSINAFLSSLIVFLCNKHKQNEDLLINTLPPCGQKRQRAHLRGQELQKPNFNSAARETISGCVISPHISAQLKPLRGIRPILNETLSSFLLMLVVMETGQLYLINIWFSQSQIRSIQVDSLFVDLWCTSVFLDSIKARASIHQSQFNRLTKRQNFHRDTKLSSWVVLKLALHVQYLPMLHTFAVEYLFSKYISWQFG